MTCPPRSSRPSSPRAARRLAGAGSLLLALAIRSAPCESRESVAGVEPDISSTGRVVAIGDVHGDFRTFLALLRRCRLVDERGSWVGGDAVFVQTGDLVDRGPDSRRALDLVMRLQQESREAGGRVVFTPGNHEIFHLLGDLRYLHDRELEPYAREETAEERVLALQEIEAFLSGPHPLLLSRTWQKVSRAFRRGELDDRFRPGFIRHHHLFGPDGRYGKWILEQDAVVKVDRNLYLHGGLSPRLGSTPHRELRERFRQDIRALLRIFDELTELKAFHPCFGITALAELVEAERAAVRRTGRPMAGELERIFGELDSIWKGPLLAEDGLVFYRGLAELEEGPLQAELREILARQHAERIVIGHTRAADQRIRGRLGGRVILIDTGLNQSAYGGHPEALEIRPGGRALTVIRLEAPGD